MIVSQDRVVAGVCYFFVVGGVVDSYSLFFSRVATKLQSAYALAKGGRAYVILSSLTR